MDEVREAGGEEERAVATDFKESPEASDSGEVGERTAVLRLCAPNWDNPVPPLTSIR